MIKQRTVFFLGAGASKPFGFPTGKELYDLVCDNAQQGMPIHKSLSKLQDIGPKVLEFRDKLYYSGLSSVDAFLEKNPRFITVGKACIYLSLVRFEEQDALYKSNDQNWYKYIFNLMQTNKLDDFASNAVTFITYNYDRSLEHFFFTSLKNTFGGRPEVDYINVANKLKIIHLHGRIAPLPWQESPGKPYDTNFQLTDLNELGKDIKIVSENIDVISDAQFEAARNACHYARRIIFLGFGYSPLNIERLYVDGWRPETQVLGTSHGLTPIQTREIERQFPHGISLDPRDASTYLKHIDLNAN